MARYRIVYYTPDPFLGGGIPIAAIVQLPDSLTVVPVPHSILDRRTAAFTAINLVVQDLMLGMVDFDLLPTSVGPHVTLGESREAPNEDTVSWVRSLVD